MTPALMAARDRLGAPERQAFEVLARAPAALHEVDVFERLLALDCPRWSRHVGQRELVLGVVLHQLGRALEGSGATLYREGRLWMLGPATPPAPAEPARVDAEDLACAELRRRAAGA